MTKKSTLDQRIARAQAVVATWSSSKLRSMTLQGQGGADFWKVAGKDVLQEAIAKAEKREGGER